MNLGSVLSFLLFKEKKERDSKNRRTKENNNFYLHENEVNDAINQGHFNVW